MRIIDNLIEIINIPIKETKSIIVEKINLKIVCSALTLLLVRINYLYNINFILSKNSKLLFK